MSLKIKFKNENAVVKWNHPLEREFFKRAMMSLRDSDPKTHPPIIVKDAMDAGRMVRRPQKTPIIQPPQSMKPVIVKPEEVRIVAEDTPEISKKTDAET